jgi:hypothetical protein
MDLQEISDRLEIQDLMTRYTHVVDFRDWARLGEVFATDATADYTPTGGISGSFEEVMSWLDRALAAWPVNLHAISNLAITFDGPDHATSQCYFTAPMAAGTVGAQVVLTNGGHYNDTLLRTDEGWRIAHRTCTTTVMIGSLPEDYQIPE